MTLIKVMPVIFTHNTNHTNHLGLKKRQDMQAIHLISNLVSFKLPHLWNVCVLVFIGILIFMLLRSPCKNLKPYDNPFRDFSNGGANKKKKKRLNYLK